MNNKLKKQGAINSYALVYLKSLLPATTKIINLMVHNKHLRATLESGVYFSVRNDI